jgi:hypothetical protein
MRTHVHTNCIMHAHTHAHTLAHIVCPPLTLFNGTVSYSMEMDVARNVESVATHTCVSGYQLLPQGIGNTRTCNINGWSGQDFMCGEYNMLASIIAIIHVPCQ